MKTTNYSNKTVPLYSKGRLDFPVDLEQSIRAQHEKVLKSTFCLKYHTEGAEAACEACLGWHLYERR